jgi:hypothetical protein
MRPNDPATEPQINYVRSLMVRRDTSTVQDLVRLVTAKIEADKLTYATVTSAINVLKSLPVIEVVAQRDQVARTNIKDAIDRVPEGRYAIQRENDNRIMFYKIDKPADGRWKGFIFVSVQAGSEYYPIKNPQSKSVVLVEIAKDPRGAAVLYGKKLERCAICNRPLTDPDSRAAGIGLICAGKQGW